MATPTKEKKGIGSADSNAIPAGKGAPAPSPPKPAASNAEEERMKELIRQIEDAFFAFRFYPVAVKEPAKEEALGRIKRMYQEGNDTVRQLILYQLHEHLAKVEELKVMHTLEHFRRQNPNTDPAQLRMQVYRSVFHYHYSLEGLVELFGFLGTLEGDDAAKLLTYHFSHLSVTESEGTHMLRGAVIEALARSPSPYALYALLRYARLTDGERLLHRILWALSEWEKKLNGLKLPDSEKKRLHEEIGQVLTTDFGDTHYG